MPPDRIVVACSCEQSMPLDESALANGCGTVKRADQLCRAELDLFRRLAGEGMPLTVSCTQEAPLFSEVANELGAEERVTYTNIREYAGWSNDAAAAGPKMAALLAAAAERANPISLVSMASKGVTLIYGHDDVAIDAARRLADHLDITVLLTKPRDVAPPRATDFPVLQGTIVNAKGHLGAFELTVDDYAVPLPSSRNKLVFGPARQGATSHCDLIVDLSGGMPLFPAHELRSGYLRADRRDPAAVERALFDASHLVGEFDKPRFIDFNEKLCAHSRSRKIGCTRCLEVCPTGAITPNGDHVALDPFVCAGCGSCASICPTGAEEYALPNSDSLLRRLRTLLQTYARAGGKNPIVLFHDGDHGEPLIFALARFGEGLPANVLPVRVNEITQVGLEALAAAFAYGAAAVRFVSRARPKHDLGALHMNVSLANTVLPALGYAETGHAVVALIKTDDPDALGTGLREIEAGTPTAKPAGFVAHGRKREVLKQSFRELHAAAPAPVSVVPLAAKAPFGGLDIDVEGCTLCLSCASACPTHALSDNAERPMLSFTESLCVQCGLCASICPEKVITLKPQIDFDAWTAPPRVVKTEEPFHCIACAKPFGTRASIERVVEKLHNRHWMFSGSEGEDRTRVLMMCEDCRIEAAVNEGFDPHGAPPRPRTTDDYLRARIEAEDKTS